VLMRSTVTVLLSMLLLVGLGVPDAEAVDVPAETRMERIAGLPAAADADAGELGAGDDHGHEHSAHALQATGSAQVSEPTRTPMPFSMVGFAVPPGAAVDFRTSVDGSAWTDWEHAAAVPDEGPDPDAAEARVAGAAGRDWSEPIWVGEAGWIQTRVTGASTSEVGFDLIDSAGLSRTWLGQARDAVAATLRSSTPPAASATTAQPDIVTRAEWGADESIRRGTPSYSRRLRFGAVHHTASASDYSQAEAPAVVRGIYAYHVRSNGWNDIGYNLLVDRFGTVYEGRAGGVDRNVIGAHAGGFNTDSFGVAFIGTHSTEGPSSAAFESMAEVFAWKFDLGHIDVSGAHTATSRGSTRYAGGTRVVLATMSGHRDLSSTSCPGQLAYGLMPALRQRVLELHGAALLDHDAEPRSATVVSGQSLDGPITLSTRLRPAGEWELEVRAPSDEVVHRDRGSGTEAVSRWAPSGAEPGTYTYTFSSPGRRSASDTVQLLPPVITAPSASPLSTTDRDGELAEPITVTARAFPGAEWTVTITDPEGDRVHSVSGDGADVRSTWTGPATGPGEYRWTIEAVGAASVSGVTEVFTDVWERSGIADDATGGSIQLSAQAFDEPLSAAHAVIARADVFADTLSGGPLAATAGPVLLNPSDALDPRVRTELERVLPPGATVYVLGGKEAISEDVADVLRGTWDVRRLAGRERTETAAAVAEVVFARAGDGQRTAMVARSGSSGDAPWADALAGGAYGAARGIPVLLTDTGKLSEATADVLDDHDVDVTLVLGGTAAVSDDVLADLPGPRRISGPDRVATAVEIARQLWGRTSAGSGDRFLLAEGYGEHAWTLALAASPLAARASAPLLLTSTAALPPATTTYLDGLGYGGASTAGGYVLGGEGSVSTPVADAASRLLQ